MTLTEVAEYLRISTATVYRLVQRKQIPVNNVGRQLRFRKDSLDEWLSNNEGQNYEPWDQVLTICNKNVTFFFSSQASF